MAGLEPARAFHPSDFKSDASTHFATSATDLLGLHVRHHHKIPSRDKERVGV